MEKVDMAGETCMECGKGQYTETSIFDDMDGIQHCSNCGHATERYINVGAVGYVEEDNKLLDKPTPTLKELSKKHNVSLGELGTQLTMGIKAELEHTSDRAIAKEIALDHLNELPDYYDRLEKVEEADNPYAAPKAAPATTAIPPQSAASSIDALAQPTDTATDVDTEEHQRKEVDDLAVGDDIEVIDIDGDPTAVTVRNPRGPGETIIVQTDKGEEHIIKKIAVSGTPMIAEDLSRHVNVEYRDPDGYFIVVHAAPAGYWPIGKGRYAQKIDQTSFTNLDDAIEHAQLSISSLEEDDLSTGNKGRSFRKPDRYEENIAINFMNGAGYVAREIGVDQNTGNIAVKDTRATDRPIFLLGRDGKVINVKRIQDKQVTTMNEESPPGMEDWIVKRKPEFKERYGKDWQEVLYATAWKQHNMKNEEYEIDVNALQEQFEKGLEEHNEEAPSVQEGDSITVRREHHIGNKVEEFVGTVIDVSQDVHGYKIGVSFNDGEGDYRAWYHVNGALSGRWYDERIVLETDENINEDESFHFFVEPYGDGHGADVMDSKGGIHDHYDDPALARQVAAELNAKYGKDKDGKSIGEAYGDVPMSQVPNRVKRAMKANDWKECEYCKDWEDGFDPRPSTYGNLCPKCNSEPPPTVWMRGEPVGEARQASKTEHSGAKKGKGGYIGRKKYAKSDSNKKRRENDKKAINEDDACPICMGSGDATEPDYIDPNDSDKCSHCKGTGSLAAAFDEGFEHYGSGADFIPVEVNGKEVGVVWKEGEGDWHAEHSKSGNSWGMIDSYEDAVELIQDEAMYESVDEDIERIKELAGIKETASGGATGAGAIAVGAVAAPFGVGGSKLIKREISSNPSIYGKTTKKPKLKDRTKESTTEDGLGRKKK
jgi:hypothetical protein